MGAKRSLPKWTAAPTPAVSPNCDGWVLISFCDVRKAGPPSTNGWSLPHINGEGRFHFNITGNSHVFADGKLNLVATAGPLVGNTVLMLSPGRDRCKASISMAKLLMSWTSSSPPKMKLWGPGRCSKLDAGLP